MGKITKITDLAKYTKEKIEERGDFQPSFKDDSGRAFFEASADQSLAENKILMETLKIFMKKIYAWDHSETESNAFFDKLICQAFYNTRLPPSDVLIGEKLLKDIINL